MNYDYTVTAVQATGTTTVDFSGVRYKVSATTHGATGREARDKVKVRIDKIRAVIGSQDGHRACINGGSINTSLTIAVDHSDRQAALVRGYKAVYTAEFTGNNVKLASEIHDALTSIEGVEASTPVFLVDRLEEAAELAFVDAAQHARAKFAAQCRAVGLSPAEFKVLSWSLQEADQARGKTLSYEQDPGEGLAPGRAVLTVRVTCYYGPK